MYYFAFSFSSTTGVTVGGDVGDILFGFRSLVSGMFRRRFIMTFTPRLENGNYVIIDVVGHAIGSPLTDNVNVVRAKEAEPLITRVRKLGADSLRECIYFPKDVHEPVYVRACRCVSACVQV